MRLDPKLVREILLTVEEYLPFREKELVWPEGYSEEELDYHLAILIDDSLVKGNYSRALAGNFYVLVEHLTPQGHKYLDAIRNEGIFKRVQAKVVDSGLASVPLEVLVQLASKAVRDSVGLE